MTDLERAHDIARRVIPGCNPDRTCIIVASAVAGLRGLTLRHIRVGALFWPAGFTDDPYLSMRGGWGCDGYDERAGRLYLADQTVDDDGGFSGHTWLEPAPGEVLDLMHDADDTARYIRRPKMERAVKQHWRAQMRAAIAHGARHRKSSNVVEKSA
jgi:hypothetical protein